MLLTSRTVYIRKNINQSRVNVQPTRNILEQIFSSGTWQIMVYRWMSGLINNARGLRKIIVCVYTPRRPRVFRAIVPLLCASIIITTLYKRFLRIRQNLFLPAAAAAASFIDSNTQQFLFTLFTKIPAVTE